MKQTAIKPSTVKRNWEDARAKVDRERVCRACGWPNVPGRAVRLEAAHVAGREHDKPKPCPVCWGEGVLTVEFKEWEVGGSCHACAGHGSLTPNVLWVNPDDVVPLCGPATDTRTCHGLQHAHRLDLLELLSLPEQLRAVECFGSLENARVHLAPSLYPAKSFGERLA